jgi:hypothetical protein
VRIGAATTDLLIGEARARQRKRRLVLAVVLAVVAVVALSIAFNRGTFGLGASSPTSSTSAAAAWRPTEDHFPYRIRNPNSVGGPEQDFYALHSTPVGASMLRYVDVAGWSILYPGRFHAVAYSLDAGPILGGPIYLQGASFANYRPVPVPNFRFYPSLRPRLPPGGVLFQLSITFASGVLGGVTERVNHVAHSPLPLVSSLGTRRAKGSVQSGSLSFQANGYIYRASFWAGQNASSSDLRGLARLISSVRFAPLKPGTKFGPFFDLRLSTCCPPPGPY